LLRAIIATALLGHWVANALADPGEYAAVGLRYEGRALYPILIQTALAVLAIAALSVLAGTRAHLAPAAEHLSRRLLTVIVVSVQVALVAGFEVTERIGIGEAYAQAFREGLFDRGFALELGIALLSAILLVALTLALAHVVRAIRRRPVHAEPSRTSGRQVRAAAIACRRRRGPRPTRFRSHSHLALAARARCTRPPRAR
jgi:uncharacterized membrane protein